MCYFFGTMGQILHSNPQQFNSLIWRLFWHKQEVCIFKDSFYFYVEWQKYIIRWSTWKLVITPMTQSEGYYYLDDVNERV